MSEKLEIGDKVKIYLDDKYGERSGWYEGVIIKIEPYSEHRSFHWVELTAEAQSILGIKQISVFNPKKIQKLA